MNCDVEIFPANEIERINVFLWRISAFLAGKIETNYTMFSEVDCQFCDFKGRLQGPCAAWRKV